MLKRSDLNPILTRADVPAVNPLLRDVSGVFNPGAVKFDDRYLLLLRVQTRGRETVLMLAESPDGERFVVRDELMKINGLESVNERIFHLYDPRITPIGDEYFIVLAADTDSGCRLATVRTADFERFELVGFDGSGDTRNGVLFPQIIDGRYLRLERPNRPGKAGDPASGGAISLSESHDLLRWRNLGTVFSGRPRYWDELIGAGPPPVKTRSGWLLVYHGVATHFQSQNIYQAGAALLDLEDPREVLARTRNNILEPRELCELTGQVPNVVFPSGMIVEQYDDEGFALPEGLVRLYYGAADTSVCLATTTIHQLITACEVA